VLQAQQETEVASCLVPGLSDGDAHFNRGRASSLSDLIAILVQCRIEGQRMAGKNGAA
jgi:hypothetical protein